LKEDTSVFSVRVKIQEYAKNQSNCFIIYLLKMKTLIFSVFKSILSELAISIYLNPCWFIMKAVSNHYSANR